MALIVRVLIIARRFAEDIVAVYKSFALQGSGDTSADKSEKETWGTRERWVLPCGTGRVLFEQASILVMSARDGIGYHGNLLNHPLGASVAVS
jgi:hypothetical protein